MAKNGFILWFTGLSGAGKSTLATHLTPVLKAKGCRVEPAPTCAWRRISVSPTTEISADSLSASCQTLPSPGIA